jgi:hypothetical protein
MLKNRSKGQSPFFYLRCASLRKDGKKEDRWRKEEDERRKKAHEGRRLR